jgi:hypothetical protein
MSSTLTVLLSGVVGVDPRWLFLSTSANEAEVLAPGFLNSIEKISGVEVGPKDFIVTVYENGTRREIFIPVFNPGRIISLQGIAGDQNVPSGITGALNVGTGQGVFAGILGSDLEFKSLKQGSGILLTPSATEILIQATGGGGGGGNFAYQNTIWLAQNGSDSNSGTSINEPLLTMAAAETKLVPNAYNVINIADAGTYELTNTFTVATGTPVSIFAPAASFIWNGPPGIDVFNILSTTAFFLNCFSVTGGPAKSLFNSQSLIQINAFQAECDNYLFNDDTLFGGSVQLASFNIRRILGGDFVFGGTSSNAIQEINADVIESSIITTNLPAQGVCRINCAYLNSSLQSAFSSIYEVNATELGPNFGYAGPATIRMNATIIDTPITTSDSVLIGTIGTDLYGNLFSYGAISGQPYRVTEVSTSGTVVIDASNWRSYANTLIVYTGSGVLSYSLTNDAAIPVGFKMRFLQLTSNNNRVGVIAGTAILTKASSNAGAYTRVAVSSFELVKTKGGVTTEWSAYGDLYQATAGATISGIYVSQTNGSDVDGDGTIEDPYKTIQVAITSAGTPLVPTTIYVMDDATYDEELTITNPNIYLSGPRARLVTSTPGDTITYSGADVFFVDFGLIQAAGGGRSFYQTSVGTTTINADLLVGNIEATLGQIYINAIGIVASMTAGAGQIGFISVFRSGTNTGNIVGISSSNTASNFNIGGLLTANNGFVANLLTYPTVDGAAGEFMTTDGAGNLSFAAAPGGSEYFQSTPVNFVGAAVTLSAAFVAGRIVQNSNAGPCTWTIDDGANLTAQFPTAVAGDTFPLYVVNGPGATISLVAGANITLFGAGSNQESATMLFRYAGGISWDVFF